MIRAVSGTSGEFSGLVQEVSGFNFGKEGFNLEESGIVREKSGFNFEESGIVFEVSGVKKWRSDVFEIKNGKNLISSLPNAADDQLRMSKIFFNW
jgi:hypothetical protein